MEYVTPKIYHLASPSIDREGLQSFLEAIGAPDWKTNAPSDQEERIEVTCQNEIVGNVIASIKRVHPYEEVAMDVYELTNW